MIEDYFNDILGKQYTEVEMASFTLPFTFIEGLTCERPCGVYNCTWVGE